MKDDDSNTEFEKAAYEQRVQRRLLLLKQYINDGKVHIKEGLSVAEALKKVRYAENGTIDLNTVDGSVRSMALAIEAMHNREELKQQASLAEIQKNYFDFIEGNFGEFFEIMKERKLTPHDTGIALSRNPEIVSQVVKDIPDFLLVLDEFWRSVGPTAIIHIEDLHESLTGVFGGDLFPAHNENIASKCGLYLDTIVLPEPYLRSKHIFERSSDQQRAYYFIKHAMNLLQYKDLACADVSPPLIVVLPDMTVFDEDEKNYIKRLGENDALIHTGKVFGRQFTTFEELISYCRDIDSIDNLKSKVVDEKRVLFDVDWVGPLEKQLERAINGKIYKDLVGTTNPGLIVASQALGRMSTCNEILIKSRQFHGTPIIDAPTSWQYLVWKLEYDASHVEKNKNLTDLHIVRGLQNISFDKMEWLGNIPPKALIEIRKNGALEEIRHILNSGIESLAKADPIDFKTTSDLVFKNIQKAFSEHKSNIELLTKKKWRFAGSGIGSWLVVGSLAVAAAATGAPVWGLAALAADQILPSPKLNEIPKSIMELLEETKKVKRSPIGILFSISKKKR